MLEHAQRFARPIEDQDDTRKLESDIVDERPWVNHVSGVCHTLINTHEQTELDLKLGVPLSLCVRRVHLLCVS